MEHCVKTRERLVLTPVRITQEVAKRAHKYGWITTLAYNRLIHNNENRSRVASPIDGNVSDISQDGNASKRRKKFNSDSFKEKKMPSTCNSVDRKHKKYKVGEDTQLNTSSSSPLQAQKEKHLKKAVNNEMDNKKETCVEICVNEESIFSHSSFQDSESIVSERKRLQAHAPDITVEQIANMSKQDQKATPSGETKAVRANSSSENMAELEDGMKCVCSSGATQTETHCRETLKKTLNSDQEVLCKESEKKINCRYKGDVLSREKLSEKMLFECGNTEVTVQCQENVSESDEIRSSTNIDKEESLQDLEKKQNKKTCHLQNDANGVTSDRHANNTDNEKCHNSDDDKRSKVKTTEMEKETMGVTEDTKTFTQTLSDDILDSLQENMIDNVSRLEAMKARLNYSLGSQLLGEGNNMSSGKLKKLLKDTVIEGVLEHPSVQEHLKNLEVYKKKLSDLEKENCRLQDDTKNLKVIMRKLCDGIAQKIQCGTQVNMDLALRTISEIEDGKNIASEDVSSSDSLREDASPCGMSNSVENERIVVKKEPQETAFSNCLSREHESCQPPLNQSAQKSLQSQLQTQEHLMLNEQVSVMERHQHEYPKLQNFLQQQESFSQEHRYQLLQNHLQQQGHQQVIQQQNRQVILQQHQQVIQQQHPQVIQQQHQQMIQQQNQQVNLQQNSQMIQQQNPQVIQQQHSQVIQQQHPQVIQQQHQQVIQQQHQQVIQQQHQQVIQQQQPGNLKQHQQEYPQLYQQQYPQNLLRLHHHRLSQQHPRYFLQHEQENPQQMMPQHQQHLHSQQSTPRNVPLQFQHLKAATSYSNGPVFYNTYVTNHQLGKPVKGASHSAGNQMYGNHSQSLVTQPLNMIRDPSSKLMRVQSSVSADIDRNEYRYNTFLEQPETRQEYSRHQVEHFGVQQQNHGCQDLQFKMSHPSWMVSKPTPGNVGRDGTREFHNGSQAPSTGVSMPTPPLTPSSVSPFVVEDNLVNINNSASVTAAGVSSFSTNILHSPPVFTKSHDNPKTTSALKRSSTKSLSNSLPPRLIVSVELKQGVVVLSWNVMKVPLTPISKYQIYAFLDDAVVGEASNRSWRVISTMSSAPLPMSCALTDFEPCTTYYFAVRSIDIYGHMGPFSELTKVTVRGDGNMQELD